MKGRFYILIMWWFHRCIHLTKLKMFALNGCIVLCVNYISIKLNVKLNTHWESRDKCEVETSRADS